jgi:hypothetical protein
MFGLLRIGERLAAIERLVRKLDEGERERAGALEARLSALAARVAKQPGAKDLRELRGAVRALASRDDRQMLDELGRIAASGRRIIVGPWTGEVGFELLYWIPFVDWMRNEWSVPAERLMVVSRGGVGSWYGVGADNYADALSFLSPAAFRSAVAEDKRKQRRQSTLDQQIVDAVCHDRGLAEFEWLHPAVMYRLFAPFWSDDAGYARVDRFTRHRLLAPPADLHRDDRFTAERMASLPRDYVAVRFYFSECFPDTVENRAFAQAVVLSLAEHQPVVMLNPGFSVDEHEDWTASAGRVLTIADRLPPETNLAIQTDVIRGARAFVGTYGGYSYLAPLCRVPALAFYSRPTFKRHHHYAAVRAFEQIGAAPLTVLDVAAAATARAALARFADAEAVGGRRRSTDAEALS